MEKNQIYAQMRQKIRRAYASGRDQTTVLIFRPNHQRRGGILGPFLDRLLGLQIDTTPEEETCRMAMLHLKHDGFKINFVRVGDRRYPYCRAIVKNIASLDPSRLS